MKILKLLFFILIITFSLCIVSCNSCEHEYSEVMTDATCTEDGKVVRTCTKCDNTSEEIIPAFGHTFSSEKIMADCDSEGYTLNTCFCGFSYKSDIVAPHEHDYSLTITPPTCAESGYTTYSCKNCEVSYKSDVTQPIGHNLSITVTEPDCLNQGYSTYKCLKCDYGYVSEYEKPLGHSLKSNTVAADCEAAGYTAYSCDNCDFSYKTDFTEPVGHKFASETLTEVACTSQGEIKYTCSCGYTYSEIVAPTGHSFSEKITAPTVNDMGYTEYSCDCGFNYVGNYRFYSEILDNAYAGNSEILARGIDISKWNHTVDSNGDFVPLDWVALKEAGVDYVILKIGSTPREDGTLGGIEPTFEMDYAGAKEAGIDVGVYYFTYAKNVREIRKDAEYILQWLRGKQFEYPIYLDVEDAPTEGHMPSEIAPPILTEMLLTFFSALQSEGYYTGLYVNNEFLFNILQTDNMIDLFEIWYARYPTYDSFVWNPEDGDTYVWNTEKYGEHLGMWQYSMTGKLSPITTDVDFNYAYKDYPTLIKMHGFNGFTVAE